MQWVHQGAVRIWDPESPEVEGHALVPPGQDATSSLGLLEQELPTWWSQSLLNQWHKKGQRP